MAAIWTILDNAKHVGIPSLMPDWDTSRFESVIGSSTNVLFGSGRNEFTLASRSDSVHVFGDLLQFVYSPSEAAKGFSKTFNVAYNVLFSGSDTTYTFGTRKDLNFYFRPGFRVDRFNSGSFAEKYNLTDEEKNTEIHCQSLGKRGFQGQGKDDPSRAALRLPGGARTSHKS